MERLVDGMDFETFLPAKFNLSDVISLRGRFWQIIYTKVRLIGALIFVFTLVSVGANGWDRGSELFPVSRLKGRSPTVQLPTDSPHTWVQSQSRISSLPIGIRAHPAGMTTDRIDFRSHYPFILKLLSDPMPGPIRIQNFVLFDYHS